MTRKHTQLTLTTIAGFVLLAMLAITIAIPIPATPAHAGTVPTPVSIMNQSDQAAIVTFLDNDTTTTDAGGPGIQLYTYEYCNLQYIIDQVGGTTAPNTTTLRIDWSMDNTNWATGPNIVASNTSDDTGIVQIPQLGRYQRVYEDHTGTSAITITVTGICK